ncbi:protein kinase [Trypanosoma theileri]|uniref:Protein kinase n=1 Tax=Trypanosoma theileri TaxID=67003 RepID=A0A1X0P3M4_9TRYP|nr:protein kinase [Trypanosoma theileri]ORC91020.1 protein kinase [Trypanosoma theileri]
MYRSRNETASRNLFLHNNSFGVDGERPEVSPNLASLSPTSPGIITPRRIVRTVKTSPPVTQLVQLDGVPPPPRPLSHVSSGSEVSEDVVDDVSEAVSLTCESDGRLVQLAPSLSVRDNTTPSFCVGTAKTATPSLARMTAGGESILSMSFHSLGTSEETSSSSSAAAGSSGEFTETSDVESVHSCSLSCGMEVRQRASSTSRHISVPAMNSSIAKDSPARGSEVSGKRHLTSRCASSVTDVMQRKKIVNVRREERIGRGSYGDVFRGVDLDTGLCLAIKEIVVTADITKNVELQLRALEREIRVMRKLNNEHIISYYSARRDEASSTLLIYMEYISGGTVAQKLKKKGPFSEDETRHYTRQLLQGLDYLHQRHIVHRDLKGDNLFLTENDVLKVGDFGTSKELKTTLITDSVAGTPNFMAPEVIACSGHSCMADIWSVGCCVLEMLTGHPPFWNLDNHMAVMFAIMKGKLEEQVPSHISEEAKDFIRHCTCSDPTHRPAARELLEHPWLITLEEKKKRESTVSPTQSCLSLMSLDTTGKDGDKNENEETSSDSSTPPNDVFQSSLAAVLAIIPERSNDIVGKGPSPSPPQPPTEIHQGTKQESKRQTSMQMASHAPMTGKKNSTQQSNKDGLHRSSTGRQHSIGNTNDNGTSQNKKIAKNSSTERSDTKGNSAVTRRSTTSISISTTKPTSKGVSATATTTTTKKKP